MYPEDFFLWDHILSPRASLNVSILRSQDRYEFRDMLQKGCHSP